MKAVQDYDAFGSLMPGRNYSSTTDTYRFGYNGMPSDQEVAGERNSYDFGARIYDPRVGRFLSTDAFSGKFPYFSPYLFAGNTPIMGVDVNGDSLALSGSRENIKQFTTLINKAFDGMVVAKVNKQGLLTLRLSEGPLSESQQAL